MSWPFDRTIVQGAIKALLHRPRFLLLAGGTMTLGISGCMVIVVLAGQLWAPPVGLSNPDGIVVALSRSHGRDRDPALFTEKDLQGLRENEAFSAVAGQVAARGSYKGLVPRVSFPSGQTVETVAVTPEYFEVLGVALYGVGSTAIAMSSGSSSTPGPSR